MVKFADISEIKEYEISEQEILEKKLTIKVISGKYKYNCMMKMMEKYRDKELWSAYHASPYPKEEPLTKLMTKNSRFNVVLAEQVEVVECIPLEFTTQPLCSYLTPCSTPKNEYKPPPQPESISRQKVVKYIKEMGDTPYLKQNKLDKNEKYISRHFKRKDLNYHYRYIVDDNELYS
jgi:hypothetical protein